MIYILYRFIILKKSFKWIRGCYLRYERLKIERKHMMSQNLEKNTRNYKLSTFYILQLFVKYRIKLFGIPKKKKKHVVHNPC